MNATSAGPIKIPTAVVKRLAVDQQNAGGGADNLTPISYDNPYSRLVVDAANQPVVFGSLPQSDIAGRILIIDNNGRVWKETQHQYYQVEEASALLQFWLELGKQNHC